MTKKYVWSRQRKKKDPVSEGGPTGQGKLKNKDGGGNPK